MVRPYAVKGRKLKRRRVEEPAPPEEEKVEDVSDEGEREGDQAAFVTAVEVEENEDERRAEEALDKIPVLPITGPVDRAKRPGVIFVLEKACLEVGKVGKVRQLVIYIFSLRDRTLRHQHVKI